MNYSMKLLLIIAALLGTIFTGCEDDIVLDPPVTEDPIVNYTVIGTATDNGILVTLYAEGDITSSYTKLYVQLRDEATSDLINGAQITLNPMMDMGNMQHSAPFENPASETAENGYFPCAVVFQMPGETGWTLQIDVTEHTEGREASVTIPISVATPNDTRTHMVTPLNGDDKLVISYLLPTEPEVGINDFEITLHYKESMMSFPPQESYTVEIEPEMPSMGHGSPNNVHPVHIENGHYQGKVNFTMTGLWRIHLDIMNGAEVVDTTSFFDITF